MRNVLHQSADLYNLPARARTEIDSGLIRAYLACSSTIEKENTTELS